MSDPRIDAFCAFLEDLAIEADVLAWDERGARLEVTGLGDPLPSGVDNDPTLFQLVEAVREISASQIYGAWQPHRMAGFVVRAAVLAGFDLQRMQEPQVLEQHDSRADGSDGWGKPIDLAARDRWRTAAQLAVAADDRAARALE